MLSAVTLDLGNTSGFCKRVRLARDPLATGKGHSRFRDPEMRLLDL
jgi:hypothetical protein